MTDPAQSARSPRPRNFIYCTPCDDVIGTAPTQTERRQRLYEHYDREHLGRQGEVRQLPTVTFHESFIAAVLAQPIGTELTTADLHALVPPPDHPNRWGTETARAAHMGLLRAITVQKSELPTTRSSLVRRWVRIDPNEVAA